MVIDCCGATRAPLLIRSFGRIGNAQSTSVGRLNNVGLGIEEPKHDLGWPTLRPLFRDTNMCIIATILLIAYEKM